eukprot:1161303-Pelagomonas_calceolata.AAC.3
MHAHASVPSLQGNAVEHGTHTHIRMHALTHTRATSHALEYDLSPSCFMAHALLAEDPSALLRQGHNAHLP